MKLGIISSYHAKCGVSSYTENLVQGLIENGIDVKVLGNYLPEKTMEDESYVARHFHVPFMTNEMTADIPKILEFFNDRDIIHVQFETNLYHDSWFCPLIRTLKELNKKIIFTMHSSGMWPTLDIRNVNFFITHSPMWCSSCIIPMSVKFYKYEEPKNYNSIVSFGLGRNNDDLVKSCIKESDVNFTTVYGHHKWRPIDDLIREIQKSWMISLLYPPVGAEVSSSAVVTAMGCGRPILVSDTNWFKHVVGFPNIYVCTSPEDVKDHIKYLTNSDNLEQIKLDIEEMEHILVKSERTLHYFVLKHIAVYNEVDIGF